MRIRLLFPSALILAFGTAGIVIAATLSTYGYVAGASFQTGDRSTTFDSDVDVSDKSASVAITNPEDAADDDPFHAASSTSGGRSFSVYAGTDQSFDSFNHDPSTDAVSMSDVGIHHRPTFAEGIEQIALEFSANGIFSAGGRLQDLSLDSGVFLDEGVTVSSEILSLNSSTGRIRSGANGSPDSSSTTELAGFYAYSGGSSFADPSVSSGVSGGGITQLYDIPIPSQVPLPASLPLALAGFGALGFVMRRRKS
tara:strand:- start:1076 stop:1837 length:762 start_codon:yes stop_codon:yes gene_type:complete